MGDLDLDLLIGFLAGLCFLTFFLTLMIFVFLGCKYLGKHDLTENWGNFVKCTFGALGLSSSSNSLRNSVNSSTSSEQSIFSTSSAASEICLLAGSFFTSFADLSSVSGSD